MYMCIERERARDIYYYCQGRQRRGWSSPSRGLGGAALGLLQSVSIISYIIAGDSIGVIAGFPIALLAGVIVGLLYNNSEYGRFP